MNDLSPHSKTWLELTVTYCSIINDNAK